MVEVGDWRETSVHLLAGIPAAIFDLNKIYSCDLSKSQFNSNQTVHVAYFAQVKIYQKLINLIINNLFKI